MGGSDHRSRFGIGFYESEAKFKVTHRPATLGSAVR